MRAFEHLGRSRKTFTRPGSPRPPASRYPMDGLSTHTIGRCDRKNAVFPRIPSGIEWRGHTSGCVLARQPHIDGCRTPSAVHELPSFPRVEGLCELAAARP